MTSLPITGLGRYSIYTGRVTNWFMVVFTSALTAPLLLLSFMSNGSESGNGWGVAGLALMLLLVLVGILVNVATATSVRVTAGPNGVAIRWGLVGWPRLNYPLADIVHAEVFDLSWWWVSWGFWWTPRRTCCTVRGGPTLRLVLRTGRTVTVSAPDPTAALAALQDARAAQVG